MGQTSGTLAKIGNGEPTIRFTINNEDYEVTPEDLAPETTLNTFIRNVAGLKGTKFMCLEGGCGACIVAIEIKDQILAANSCLIPILICDGWKINTIEGIGSKMKGYYTLQTALAEMNGTQCGFCSPGMVMNMYSLVQTGNMTMQEIENSFGSNICRCTGYRPILDTFKSFANDASVTAKRQIVDIEDLYKLKACARAKSFGENNFGEFKFINKTDEAPRALHLELKNATFHKVLSINDLFSVFQHEPESYVLNGGNTAHGVYRLEKRKVYIDINDIPDLSHIVKDDASLTVGGNVTLTNAMRAFNKFSKEQGFEYLEQLAKHIDLIASVPIRNIGTIAGNLMIKHQNRDFPSDLFLILQTAGTKIHILESPSSKLIMTLLEFLDINMQYKVIYSLELPSLEESSYLRTFKIMPRSQNAHAIINAGFLFKMDNQRNVLDKPNIIFGGISPDLLHATKTEQFLIGKTLTNKSVISEALKILGSELNPDHVLPDKNPEYRRLLSQGLFYKFVLGIVTDTIDPKLKSGSTLLERSLSSGRQDFDTDRNIWPINKPIKKLEAMNQTSGEAEYVNDIPIQQNEVFCAFVLAEAPSEFTKIDISEAMTVDGFVAFFSASDIPGRNTFICPDHKLPFLDENEEVFADKIVTYAGQPVGLTVAKSHLAAMEAAKKVKILYADGPRRKAILSIDQALASNEKTRISKAANFPAQKPPGKNVQHVIRGNFNNGSQYHFSMETQCCVCVPLEDGMDIYSSTQWMDLIQASTSAVLNIPMNSINVIVRRVGGSYGGKVSRSAQLACACALAAHKLNVPARLVLSIEDNMKAMGKRYGMKQEYEVGVDEKGVIQYMNSEIWANSGSSFNDTHGPLTLTHLYNCYDGSNWNSVAYDVKTDIPSNTWCRAPGSCEAVGMVENIMEHIAKVTGNNPIEVRLANMDENDKVALEPMIEELKQLSDFDATEKSFKSFNNENRWKKRGISIVIMKYPMFTFFNFHVLVSIYARDGSVTVVHGGIEMGQGINTKVAQAVAFTLGIELDMVSVKPSNTLTSANDCGSGGSITSESCVYGAVMSCKELLKRLSPIKEELGNRTWKELVLDAATKNVDLSATYWYTPVTSPVQYGVYGVAAIQVEVDVLTGQHIVHRADIIEDAGISMSPLVDVGQVEGSFVMGLGFWTIEELIYDPETAELTNHRTWNYKVPGAKDIPVDFRVTFRRNAPNATGILRSKATGEPPLCLSYGIVVAIRNALNSARIDAGIEDTWYQLDGPVTSDKILLASLTTTESMIL